MGNISNKLDDPYEIEVEFMGEKRKALAYPKRSGGFVFWSPFNGERIRVTHLTGKRRSFKKLPSISFTDNNYDPPPRHCYFCGHPAGTRHHLTPRSHGGRTTIRLCYVCHPAVHKLFTNDELAARFNTARALKIEFVKRYNMARV